MVFRVGHENTAGARLSILDMRGRAVWNGAFDRGAGQLVWDGRSVRGRTVSTGVYVARLIVLDKQGKAAQVMDKKVPFTR